MTYDEIIFHSMTRLFPEQCIHYSFGVEIYRCCGICRYDRIIITLITVAIRVRHPPYVAYVFLVKKVY
ncbi:hypothetical protein QE152_g8078 [Popillia japonica]|uniref:Uncharacterized protein n=1 Tax=Popillia japonica TaxID=7064 RepID=A0AAW1M636_POPJA